MNTARIEMNYWDALYQRREYVYGTAPSRYLLQNRWLLRPGMAALAIGDGEGRNGVWLAAQGLLVVSVERSPFGIQKARRLALSQRLELTFECCDLLDWEWPFEKFDVVAAMYLHLRTRDRKKIHRRIANCLKPGGFLLLEAFRRSHHRAAGHRRASQSLFTGGLLREDFAQLELLELLEGTVVLNEGRMHQGKAEIIRVLARKNAREKD